MFQDPKLANAILDRILHHATVVNIVGDSYRIKHRKRNRKRVKMYILKQSKVYLNGSNLLFLCFRLDLEGGLGE